jgi:thiamine-phosphate pyrophosphorylase
VHANKPILCYVTSRRELVSAEAAHVTPASGRPDDALAPLGERIRSAIAAGVDWVQVREKDLAARLLLDIVKQAVAAAREASDRRLPGGLADPSPAAAATKILVNDRLDVALAAGADGVHLGGESAPVDEVARWRARRTATPGCAPSSLSDTFLIGVSCHSLDEALAAEAGGADYIFFGPVFDTPSKRAFGPPRGLARLSKVCRAVKIPVLAIGGLTLENAGDCLRAGAAGIAAIRLFQEAADIAKLAAALRGK